MSDHPKTIHSNRSESRILTIRHVRTLTWPPHRCLKEMELNVAFESSASFEIPAFAPR